MRQVPGRCLLQSTEQHCSGEITNSSSKIYEMRPLAEGCAMPLSAGDVGDRVANYTPTDRGRPKVELRRPLGSNHVQVSTCARHSAH